MPRDERPGIAVSPTPPKEIAIKNFQDRAAVVTGAAGGIGGSAAVRLAQGGASVALFDLNLDALEATADQCRAAGAKVITVATDQTDPAAVQNGVDQTIAAFGKIDILSANAGYAGLSSLLDQSLDEWNKHLAVNLTGTMLLAQAVARTMVERKSGGAIVIVSSGAAVHHIDLASAYCVSKAGTKMLTEGLASELGPHRIRVNGIMPGLIETNMTAPIFELSPTSKRHHISRIPVGHLGTPDDVGALVAFLASDEARFINGHSVMVDGGELLHDFQWYLQDYTESHRQTWTGV